MPSLIWRSKNKSTLEKLDIVFGPPETIEHNEIELHIMDWTECPMEDDDPMYKTTMHKNDIAAYKPFADLIILDFFKEGDQCEVSIKAPGENELVPWRTCWRITSSNKAFLDDFSI